MAKLRHPYNFENDINNIVAQELEHRDESFLIQPILSSSKDILRTDNLGTAYTYVIAPDKDLGTQQDPIYKKADTFKGTLESLSYNNDEYMFFINYFFNDPLETPDQKIKYLESGAKIKTPKKCIIRLVGNKEINVSKLNYVDKSLLRLGLNQEEIFKEELKPYLKEYFLEAGIKEIKKLYDSINYIDPDLDMSSSDINAEYFLFDRILLRKPILDKIRDNPNITDYITYLENCLKFSQESYLEAQDQYKKTLDIFNNNLSKNHVKLEEIIKHVEDKHSKTFDEIYSDDKKIYLWFVNFNINRDDFKDDLDYLNSLKESKNILDNLYLSYIDLGYKEDYFLPDKQSKIKWYNLQIENCKDPIGINKKINDLLKMLLDPKYHFRDFKQVEEYRETNKGNLAIYSNSHVNELMFSALSFKNLNEEELSEAENISRDIIELKNKKTSLKSLINDPKTSDEIADLSSNELKEIDNQIKELELTKKSKGYISFLSKDENGSPIITYHKAKLTSNAKEIDYSETDNHIYIKIDDCNLEIVKPKVITIKTTYQQKEIYEEHNLSEFTADTNTKFSAFLGLILKKASNTKKDFITLELDKTLSDIGFTDSNKRKGINKIKVFLTTLRDQRMDLIDKSKDASFGSVSFVESFLVNTRDNSININLGLAIKTMTKNTDSKIWLNSSATFDTPEQALIYYKAGSLLNQTNINSYDNEGNFKNKRSISLSSLINSVPNYAFYFDPNNKNVNRDIIKPIYSDLKTINKNQLVPISFDLKGFKASYINSYDDILNIMLEGSFKAGEIPEKILLQEENLKRKIELEKTTSNNHKKTLKNKR